MSAGKSRYVSSANVYAFATFTFGSPPRTSSFVTARPVRPFTRADIRTMTRASQPIRRGERPRPDAGRERLHDADDLVQPLRSDAGADRGRGRDAVRARAVRVDPVVDAQVRAVGPLEEDPPPPPHPPV